MPKPTFRDVTALASAQDRCVTRQQLLSLGMNPSHVDSFVRNGLITIVVDGVYVVGTPVLSDREFLRCAQFFAGAHSYFTERCAAEIRGYVRRRPGTATLATPVEGCQRTVRTRVPVGVNRSPGLIRVRHSNPAAAPSLETFRDFVLTSVPRTLIDIAGTLDLNVLRAAWKEAEFLGLLDPVAIRAELARGKRKGAVAVRSLLREHAPITRTRFRSRKELRLLRTLLVDPDLPRPELNVRLELGGEPYVADFLFRHLGLVVEFDGPSHHLPSKIDDDKARDIEFFVGELDVLRISDRDLKLRPDWCREKIRAAVLRQLRRLSVA
jgi:very-short-patch-repair endonuclease